MGVLCFLHFDLRLWSHQWNILREGKLGRGRARLAKREIAGTTRAQVWPSVNVLWKLPAVGRPQTAWDSVVNKDPVEMEVYQHVPFIQLPLLDEGFVLGKGTSSQRPL